MTATATVARTEIEVAADTIVALVRSGLVRGGTSSLTLAAEAAGLMAGEVHAAIARSKTSGWQPPRRTPALAVQDGVPVPVPTVEDQTPGNRDRFARANPAPGMRRCCRCREVKPIDAFNVRNKKTGNRASMCIQCGKDYARERYLSVTKVKALNAVGIAFTVGEADDVDGVTCLDCGAPIVAGQQVHGQAGLRHTTCPEAA